MKFFQILIFLIGLSLQSQVIKDSISVEKDSVNFYIKDSLFTDNDLKIIDSLIVAEKFNSSLIDTLEYVLNDKDIQENTVVVLTTDLLKKRLSLLNQKTPFNLSFNPALEKIINSYLNQRKKYYPELMARAKYYFPMFEKYLDQYDIPLEMKYLAIVESALQPKIKSRAGATGLWQFMYGTGIQFNLNVSSYVDERQDPVKSTIAACEYLSQLFSIFGDWDLALAAYNSGPGNVTKAIKRSGGYTNYWNIRPFLPMETAGYVPAFYATMYIFEYAEEHQIYPNIPKFFNFETDTIQVKRTIGFDQISEVLALDDEIITFLNPAYKLDIIPFVENKNYALRLPKDKIIEFLNKEKDLYALADEDEAKREKPLPEFFEMDKRIRYKVKSGDYLGKIANQYGVRVSDIKKWNSLKNNNLRVGQSIYLFPRKIPIVVKETKTQPAAQKIFVPEKGSFDEYVVQEGDSLWTISKKFDKVSVEDLKKWNNIWGNRVLKPGMKLKILKG